MEQLSGLDLDYDAIKDVFKKTEAEQAAHYSNDEN